MNGRSPALAALATIATLLSGCLSPADLLQAASVDGEITALEDRDLADNAARAWSSDAQLAGVFGLELSESHAEDAEGAWPQDPDAGNGRAPAWVYVYSDGAGNGSRAFRVTAEGRVTSENQTSDAIPDEAASIADWAIDSDAAVETARGNATFAEALDGDNVTLAEGVARIEGRTAWYLAAISADASAFAIVDAVTGELVSVDAFGMDLFVPDFAPRAYAYRAAPTHIEGKGHLDNGKMKDEHPFVASPGVAKLALKATRQLPTDGIAWKVLDEDGDVVASGSSGIGPGMSGGVKVKFDIKEPGEHTLLLAYRGLPGPFGGVDYAFELTVGEMDHDAAHEDD